ncbi:MAG: hypothetical protein H8M99_02135 [Gloeobacteraceae cyanobacterium ES-bin-144]|nr:hypothetical protein [Verrucomicrobiales bacterium]
MSTTTPTPLNPSLAVERIREIIVGRHLEKLEQRVARLEAAGPNNSAPAHLEDRLCTAEARLEALQESFQRLTSSNQEYHEIRSEQQREEIQRLASQIQQIAAQKSADTSSQSILQLEQKIGTWLTNWQSSLHNHLNDRETRLASSIRGEVATLWENTESQITRLQSRSLDRDSVEERFSRIAEAARALAECAMPTPSGNR